MLLGNSVSVDPPKSRFRGIFLHVEYIRELKNQPSHVHEDDKSGMSKDQKSLLFLVLLIDVSSFNKFNLLSSRFFNE